jgi:hypothetical protein
MWVRTHQHCGEWRRVASIAALHRAAFRSLIASITLLLCVLPELFFTDCQYPLSAGPIKANPLRPTAFSGAKIAHCESATLANPYAEVLAREGTRTLQQANCSARAVNGAIYQPDLPTDSKMDGEKGTK